jgi:formate C-acetyltransferase
MSAVKLHVFDEKNVTMETLLAALDNNFETDESLRQMFVNRTPAYGNDDDYADSLTAELFEMYYQLVDGRPNGKGGKHRVNLLPTTCHIYFGSVVGALPNGRKAGLPVSDGISPHQGSDINGPTAVLRSAARIDHARTGGTLLNMKFSPQLFDETGLKKLEHLIRTYFKLDGHHIQFNVIDSHTLRKAQEEPELHRNLIVRVAGYSDYFIDLGRDLQNEIIFRTEQKI